VQKNLKGETTMKENMKFTLSAMIWAVILLAASAISSHAQTGATDNHFATQKKNKSGNGGDTVTPQACCPLVQGTGTVGRLPKWTNFTGSNFVLGDSVMTESVGNIGIGIDSPTSKLTVAGMIQTTLGGLKFPDGTVQTTAASSPVQLVTSINGLKGDVQLAAGSGISIVPNGNTLTISAPGLVNHDTTLYGVGSGASPLGVAVPLTLSGAIAQQPGAVQFQSVLTVVNTETQLGANGISATGGDTNTAANYIDAGIGIFAIGGNSKNQGFAGTGVYGRGGDSGFSLSGDGVLGVGGKGLHFGGYGVRAVGGQHTDKSGSGGVGLDAVGADGAGAGYSGGYGLRAVGGNGSDGATAGSGLYARGGEVFPGAIKGMAGYFDGGVEVHGSFSVTGGGTKNFKIDHPLDPEISTSITPPSNPRKFSTSTAATSPRMKAARRQSPCQIGSRPSTATSAISSPLSALSRKPLSAIRSKTIASSSRPTRLV